MDFDDFEDFEPDDPEFLAGLADTVDSRPMLIACKMGGYSPRKFRKAVKKLSKHFSIPNNLTALIAVAGMHDYEVAIYANFVFLFRVDTIFAEIVTYEPIVLRHTLEMETDPKVIQFV